MANDPFKLAMLLKSNLPPILRDVTLSEVFKNCFDLFNAIPPSLGMWKEMLACLAQHVTFNFCRQGDSAPGLSLMQLLHRSAKIFIHQRLLRNVKPTEANLRQAMTSSRGMGLLTFVLPVLKPDGPVKELAFLLERHITNCLMNLCLGILSATEQKNISALVERELEKILTDSVRLARYFFPDAKTSDNLLENMLRMDINEPEFKSGAALVTVAITHYFERFGEENKKVPASLPFSNKEMEALTEQKKLLKVSSSLDLLTEDNDGQESLNVADVTRVACFLLKLNHGECADDMVGLCVRYVQYVTEHVALGEIPRLGSPPLFLNCLRKLSKRYVIEEVVTSRVPNETNIRVVVEHKLDNCAWLKALDSLPTYDEIDFPATLHSLLLEHFPPLLTFMGNSNDNGMFGLRLCERVLNLVRDFLQIANFSLTAPLSTLLTDSDTLTVGTVVSEEELRLLARFIAAPERMWEKMMQDTSEGLVGEGLEGKGLEGEGQRDGGRPQLREEQLKHIVYKKKEDSEKRSLKRKSSDSNLNATASKQPRI